jgi:hypothetical protein
LVEEGVGVLGQKVVMCGTLSTIVELDMIVEQMLEASHGSFGKEGRRR